MKASLIITLWAVSVAAILLLSCYAEAPPAPTAEKPHGADARHAAPVNHGPHVDKWVSRDFTLFSSALTHVNSLPAGKRAHAYIIAMNSERSSAISGYYIAVFPE